MKKNKTYESPEVLSQALSFRGMLMASVNLTPLSEDNEDASSEIIQF